MGYKAMAKLSGFAAMGGEVPYIDPEAIRIVGLDVAETADNWFAHCARVNDIPEEEVLAYAESIALAGKVDHVVKVFRDGDALVALDGRTTTRAARIARGLQAKRKIPADERVTVRVQIVKGDPEELYRVNLDSHKHRPLTRTQYAKGVLTYYQRVGENLAKTAAFFRVDPATVKVLLAHFDLTEEAQRAIDRKEVPAIVTKKLARMSRDKQNATIADMKRNGATKGGAAIQAVERAAKGEKIDGGNGVLHFRSRVVVKRFREAVETLLPESREREVVLAVMAWFTGNDEAFKGLPKFEALVFEATKDRRKKEVKEEAS